MIAAFLVEDQVPVERETVCEGVVASGFVPLAPVDAAEFETPLEALAAVDNEIYYLPEYYYWEYETPIALACPFGGRLAIEPGEAGETFTLADCAFSDSFVLTGEGFYNHEDALLTLEVTVSGLASGALVYTRDAEWSLTVTGEYDGQAIELSE
jgi:hypothetical protein